ncbi:MAG: DUF1028 domain-containing protein [Deltaproteobacteria bacterium]|nr:MAG: DUF1028 domain-containing protein [Deltaproteobacteria bacterium]
MPAGGCAPPATADPPAAEPAGAPAAPPNRRAGAVAAFGDTAVPRRPVHTFSIVARDPRTGDLGVAVQSHWFSVGSVVTWAEAGVGAVATQSFAEPAYGPRGLQLMASGMSARAALDALVSVDPARDVRQVAFVDARGEVAVHTGKACIAEAGHVTGDGFSVQANMMGNDRVVPAMARAFRRARGPLAERLVAALEAGQAAGGDIRGRQSAALLVVRGEATGQPWRDRLVDLRVEDHPAPVAELRRLLTVHRAYEHMNDGDAAMERKDMAAALRHYRAAAKLAPDNLEIVYWHAVALASNGRLAQSLPLFRKVFAADANWIELTRRLERPGLLARDAIETIVARAAGAGSAPAR